MTKQNWSKKYKVGSMYTNQSVLYNKYYTYYVSTKIYKLKKENRINTQYQQKKAKNIRDAEKALEKNLTPFPSEDSQKQNKAKAIRLSQEMQQRHLKKSNTFP